MFFIKLFLASFPIVYAGKIPKKDYGLFGVMYKKGPFRNFKNVPFIPGRKMRVNGSKFCYSNNQLAPCDGTQEGMVPIAQVDFYHLKKFKKRQKFKKRPRLRLVKDLDSTPAYVVILAPPECEVHIPTLPLAKQQKFNLLCGEADDATEERPGVEIYYQVKRGYKKRDAENLFSSGIMVYFPTASGRLAEKGQLESLSNFKIVGAKVIGGFLEVGLQGDTLIPAKHIKKSNLFPYGGGSRSIVDTITEGVILKTDHFFNEWRSADRMSVTCLTEGSTVPYKHDVPCFITAGKGYLGPFMKDTKSRRSMLENVGSYDLTAYGSESRQLRRRNA